VAGKAGPAWRQGSGAVGASAGGDKRAEPDGPAARAAKAHLPGANREAQGFILGYQPLYSREVREAQGDASGDLPQAQEGNGRRAVCEVGEGRGPVARAVAAAVPEPESELMPLVRHTELLSAVALGTSPSHLATIEGQSGG